MKDKSWGSFQYIGSLMNRNVLCLQAYAIQKLDFLSLQINFLLNFKIINQSRESIESSSNAKLHSYTKLLVIGTLRSTSRVIIIYNSYEALCYGREQYYNQMNAFKETNPSEYVHYI